MTTSERAPEPGNAWLEIVRRPTLDSFAQAFSKDCVLEAVVLATPLRGVRAVRRFFQATRAMYDDIAFLHELHAERRVCLEWAGLFQGREISGATILVSDAHGAILGIRLYHYPPDQQTAFASDLTRRLVNVAEESSTATGVDNENDG